MLALFLRTIFCQSLRFLSQIQQNQLWNTTQNQKNQLFTQRSHLKNEKIQLK